MMILLATGMMYLSTMAIVTAAITVERLSPRPQHAARATGVVVIAAGVFVIARALSVA
jgi:predicted metal-binding membrane protein